MRHTPNEAARVFPDVKRILDDAERDWPALHKALFDAMPGYPTATMCGAPGSGSLHSDPTMRLALQDDNTAGPDLQLLYEALEAIHGWADIMWRIRANWRPATAVVQRCKNPVGCPGHRVAAPDRGGLCQPCSRAGVKVKDVA